MALVLVLATHLRKENVSVGTHVVFLTVKVVEVGVEVEGVDEDEEVKVVEVEEEEDEVMDSTMVEEGEGVVRIDYGINAMTTQINKKLTIFFNKYDNDVKCAPRKSQISSYVPCR